MWSEPRLGSSSAAEGAEGSAGLCAAALSLFELLLLPAWLPQLPLPGLSSDSDSGNVSISVLGGGNPI